MDTTVYRGAMPGAGVQCGDQGPGRPPGASGPPLRPADGRVEDRRPGFAGPGVWWRRLPLDLWLLPLAVLLLHVATAPGYGYFRDELYYLASAEHLAWGYEPGDGLQGHEDVVGELAGGSGTWNASSPACSRLSVGTAILPTPH